MLHPAATNQMLAGESMAARRPADTPARRVQSSRPQWSAAVAAAVTIHAILFTALALWGLNSLSGRAGDREGEGRAGSGNRMIPISLTRTPGAGSADDSLPEAVTGTPAPGEDGPPVERQSPVRRTLDAPEPVAAPEETLLPGVGTPPPPTDMSSQRSAETDPTPTTATPTGETAHSPAAREVATAPGDTTPLRSGSAAGDTAANAEIPGGNSAGTETGSNTASPAYLVDMQQQVQATLRYARRAQRRGIEGEVVVTVVLDAAGALKRSRVQSSSGRRVLDDDALRTARRAAPFGPPPDPLIGVEIEIPVSYGLVEAPLGAR